MAVNQDKLKQDIDELQSIFDECNVLEKEQVDIAILVKALLEKIPDYQSEEMEQLLVVEFSENQTSEISKETFVRKFLEIQYPGCNYWCAEDKSSSSDESVPFQRKEPRQAHKSSPYNSGVVVSQVLDVSYLESSVISDVNVSLDKQAEANYIAQIQKLQSVNHDLKEQLSVAEESNQSLSQVIDQQRNALKQNKEIYDRLEIKKEEYDYLKDDYELLLKKNEGLQKELQVKDQHIANLKNSLEVSDQNLIQSKLEFDRLAQTHAGCSKDISAAKEELYAIGKMKMEAESQLEQMGHSLYELEEFNKSMRSENNMLKNERINLQTELQEIRALEGNIAFHGLEVDDNMNNSCASLYQYEDGVSLGVTNCFIMPRLGNEAGSIRDEILASFQQSYAMLNDGSGDEGVLQLPGKPFESHFMAHEKETLSTIASKVLVNSSKFETVALHYLKKIKYIIKNVADNLSDMERLREVLCIMDVLCVCLNHNTKWATFYSSLNQDYCIPDALAVALKFVASAKADTNTVQSFSIESKEDSFDCVVPEVSSSVFLDMFATEYNKGGANCQREFSFSRLATLSSTPMVGRDKQKQGRGESFEKVPSCPDFRKLADHTGSSRSRSYSVSAAVSIIHQPDTNNRKMVINMADGYQMIQTACNDQAPGGICVPFLVPTGLAPMEIKVSKPLAKLTKVVVLMFLLMFMLLVFTVLFKQNTNDIMCIILREFAQNEFVWPALELRHYGTPPY